MSEIPVNDSLNHIREDYITDSFSRKGINITVYTMRLKKLRFNNEIIQVILLDFEDEVDKEKLARFNVENTRKLVIGGVVIAFILITILSAMGILFGTSFISYTFFGGITMALLAALKGYDEIKNRKRRKEVRELFWKERSYH